MYAVAEKPVEMMKCIMRSCKGGNRGERPRSVLCFASSTEVICSDVWTTWHPEIPGSFVCLKPGTQDGMHPLNTAPAATAVLALFAHIA